jgi:preprotein translocase subunit SecY
MKKISLFIFLFILSSFAIETLAQCPMCVTAVEEARKNGTQVGDTLNNGILYLLVLPYAIAIVFGIIYWRNQKLKKKTIQQP